MHGAVKTDNGVRTLALSPELGATLLEQKERQLAKGHSFLFSTGTGGPVDSSLYVTRKFRPLLVALEISHAAFHAFRHFNASLLSSLRIPLKAIQDRLGHASVESLTLDVYTHSEWEQNVEAAELAGQAIQKAVNSVSLTAIQQKGPAEECRQVPVAA